MIDRKFARELFNPVTVTGIAIGTAAVIQFVVFVILDNLAIVSMGNGVGPGLFLLFGLGLGGALLVIGVIFALNK